jgi:hypothetical protein
MKKFNSKGVFLELINLYQFLIKSLKNEEEGRDIVKTNNYMK